MKIVRFDASPAELLRALDTLAAEIARARRRLGIKE
jgi:hypothetical protein